MLASISPLPARKVIGSRRRTWFGQKARGRFERGALVYASTPFAKLLVLLRLALLGPLLGGCGDPVRDSAVDRLGPEVSGVPKGPLHRPGQPCLLCHSDAGGEEPFSLAGTVYIDAPSATVIDGVEVHIVDSAGKKFSTVTNCAGNFIARPSDYSPDFPCWVSLRSGNVLREMDSPIYREGSCAACHSDPRNPASAGHVFLIDDPTIEQAPVSKCR